LTRVVVALLIRSCRDALVRTCYGEVALCVLMWGGFRGGEPSSDDGGGGEAMAASGREAM
jgi:hypothetical protein